MARFILTLQPASGHLQPLLPYLRALSSRHEVVVATSESFVPSVEKAGLRARACGTDWLESEAEATFPELADVPMAELGQYWLRELFLGPAATAMARDVEELAREWQPDVILSESWEFGGHLAAELVEVPHAVCAIGTRFPPSVLHELAGDRLEARRREVGLPDDQAAARLYHWACLSSLPQSWLNPADGPLPTEHLFAPLSAVRNAPDEAPSWLRDLSDDRPLVYVTLGTVFNRTAGVMETILEGLAEGPWAVVATVGRNRDPAELWPQPDNVRVEPFVPHAEVLPFCDAIVSHGGFTTTIDAVHAGLPHVAVPLTADQPVHATAIERLELGRMVDHRTIDLEEWPQVAPDRLTPEMVRDAVTALFDADAAHRAAIRRLRDEIAELPGPEAFVGSLGQLVEQRRPLVRSDAT